MNWFLALENSAMKGYCCPNTFIFLDHRKLPWPLNLQWSSPWTGSWRWRILPWKGYCCPNTFIYHNLRKRALLLLPWPFNLPWSRLFLGNGKPLAHMGTLSRKGCFCLDPFTFRNPAHKLVLSIGKVCQEKAILPVPGLLNLPWSSPWSSYKWTLSQKACFFTLKLTVIQPILGMGKQGHEKAIATLTLSFSVITESYLDP